MEQKAKELVYLDPGRYISFESIKYLVIGLSSFSIFLLIAGMVLKSVLLLTQLFVWLGSNISLVCVLYSKRVTKTFRLRFLVNGLMSLSISSFLWLFLSAFCIAKDPDLMWWVLGSLVLFTAVYVACIVYGVHKGFFKKLKKASQNKRFLKISGIAGGLIPISGTLGWLIARSAKGTVSVDIKEILMIFGFIFVIFASALGFINFVQYYYCVRYGINCDENGDTTSPDLEPPPKKKPKKRSRLAKVGLTLLKIIGSLFALMIIASIIQLIKSQ